MKSTHCQLLDGQDWLLHGLMYGYVPLELLAQPQLEDAVDTDSDRVETAIAAGDRQPLNLAWPLLVITLLLSLIGLTSVGISTRIPPSSPLSHANQVGAIGR